MFFSREKKAFKNKFGNKLFYLMKFYKNPLIKYYNKNNSFVTKNLLYKKNHLLTYAKHAFFFNKRRKKYLIRKKRYSLKGNILIRKKHWMKENKIKKFVAKFLYNKKVTNQKELFFKQYAKGKLRIYLKRKRSFSKKFKQKNIRKRYMFTSPRKKQRKIILKTKKSIYKKKIKLWKKYRNKPLLKKKKKKLSPSRKKFKTIKFYGKKK